MKTFIIDLDSLSNDLFKELLGFIHTIGVSFRKVNNVVNDKVGQSLVVETSSRHEEKALKEFLVKQGISSPIVIGNANKANLEGKKLGVFCQVNSTEGLNSYYLDKNTGKKFSIIQGG